MKRKISNGITQIRLLKIKGKADGNQRGFSILREKNTPLSM
jgi:hypothetical protein